MLNKSVECQRCGASVKRKREAQVYCSEHCRDTAKKQRKRQMRSGDAKLALIFHSGLPTGSESRSDDKMVGDLYWGGGPLQGDDYALAYYEDGYPELPACLDRRHKPTLAEAA
jgi:predicted nucleic acid-binding Zn ribbon protein